MDVISAKCDSCGHVVRVPKSLGGKRAKCPQCGNTINIPSPAQTSVDLVSDEDLPVVAETDDISEDDDEPVAKEGGEEEEEERPRSRRLDPGRRGRKRGGRQPATGRGGRQGGRGGYTGGRRRKGSPVVLIVTLVVALGLVMAIVIVVASQGGGPPKKNGQGEKAVKGPAVPPERTEDDANLQARCEAYVRAVKGQNPQTIVRYFAPDEQKAGLRAANRLVNDKVTYGNASVMSAVASTGTTVLSYEEGGQKREKTLKWRKVEDKWYRTLR